MKKFLAKLSIIFFWLIVWEFIAILINNTLLFPDPLKVFVRLLQLIITSTFWISLFASLLRVMLGIFIAIIIGLTLALICYKFKIIYAILNPMMTIIKSTPVASFIILIVLFIGKDIVPTIISLLMVMPVVWANVYEGLSNIDNDLKEVCKVYNLSFKKKVKVLYFPSVLPFFTASVLSSIGLGWKAGIAAEILYPPLQSIGRAILDSKQLFITEDLFAWTFVVIALSLLFEFMVKLSLKFASKEKGGERNENN